MNEHTKLYGICENKCLVPVYSSEQIDEKLGEVKKIVVLTQSEYDSLSEVGENTLYLITE